MPGAYAHITAAQAAAQRLDAVPGLPPAARPLILTNLEFVQLGALGPDLPYLDLYHRDDREWADAMHYDLVGRRIQVGIDVARGLQGQEREKALAWLLGFTAHVVADVTIHPVVERKVGTYEGNETAHRVCEMHQDVHIFSTRSGLDFHQAEFLKTMAELCSDPAHGSRLHPAVSHLWTQMLKRTDGALFVANEPHIDAWYSWFKAMVGGVGDERLLGLARHVLPWLDGVAYPLPGDVDRAEYIDALATPGGVQTYDQVFDRAVDAIRGAWAVVASDVLAGSGLAAAFLRDWNLDTGQEPGGTLTFWS